MCENKEENVLCWLLQTRREGRKSQVNPASLLQLAHSYFQLSLCFFRSSSSFCPLTQETLALPRQRDKEVEGPSLPLQISCNCRVIKRLWEKKRERKPRKRGRENGTYTNRSEVKPCEICRYARANTLEIFRVCSQK